MIHRGFRSIVSLTSWSEHIFEKVYNDIIFITVPKYIPTCLNYTNTFPQSTIQSLNQPKNHVKDNQRELNFPPLRTYDHMWIIHYKYISNTSKRFFWYRICNFTMFESFERQIYIKFDFLFNNKFILPNKGIHASFLKLLEVLTQERERKKERTAHLPDRATVAI